MSSVKQLGKDRWRARYAWTPKGEPRREITKITRTKSAGERWIDEQKALSGKGISLEPGDGKVTLRSFYAEWADSQLWASSTREANNMAMAGCTFADLPLRDVRQAHASRWVKTLDETLAPSTIRTRVGYVRGVIKGAIENRIITDDPTRGVKLPRLRKAEHAMTIPTSAQVGAILSACETWFRPFLLLGAFAGLRIGEISGVKVEDIDWSDRSIHVQRQVQKVTGGIEVIPPKHGSERIVYVPDELIDEVRTHIETVGTHGGYLLPGNPPNPDSLRHVFNRVATLSNEKVGAGAFTPHDLRHYFASGLIAAGAPITTVQRALGHAKADTTLRVYAHLWDTAPEVTREAAGAMMRDALGQNASRSRQSGSNTR